MAYEKLKKIKYARQKGAAKNIAQQAPPSATSKQKPKTLVLPLSYFWFKDLVKELVAYKHFPDALAITFAFISMVIAFRFYPLLAIVPLVVLVFVLTMIHPVIGLMALLFFSYPPLMYQAPLLGWTFGIFVAAALFAGVVHYRTVSFLFSLIMLPLSPIGSLLELPVFIVAVLVLGFKRASIATIFAFLFIVAFAGLTGLPVSAPIAYNSTAANKLVLESSISQYLVPSKSAPSLGQFGTALSKSVAGFFSLNIASNIFSGYVLAGHALAYSFSTTLVQLLVWLILIFAMTDYAVKSRSSFKGAEASLFSIVVPIVYIFTAYASGISPDIPLALASFAVSPVLLFILESQNIEVVLALNVMKQDLFGKFGSGENLITPTETFNDVANYDNVKKELYEAVIAPIEHREIAGAYGVQPAKGILLFGPPGTGKTLIMRALANEIRAGFYYVTASSLITAYPGESGDALNKIFEVAKKHAPAVVFIDEIDSVARNRSGDISEPEKEIVTTILTSMDGFLKTPGVVIVGATNAPNLLDPALLRPGRFDKAIYLALPDQKGREAIFKYYFSKLPIVKDIDYGKLAEMTPRFSGADIKHVADEVAMEVSEEAIAFKKVLQINMDDILKVLKSTKPSTSLAAIEQYNAFKMDFERTLHPEKQEESKTKVTTDDVIGLDEAKKALYEAVEVPILHQDLVKKYGVAGIKGILLFGPPGTGKTMLMKAIANELGEVHFVSISGSDISRMGLENAVSTVKGLFNRAKENEPAIIFIDEIDALIPERDTTNELGAQLVGEFLQEFDALKEEGENIIVVAATNRPDSVDPALLRSGRFDKLIYVPPPNNDERAALFKEYLSNAPLAGDIDFSKLVAMTEGYTGADIANICRQVKMNALEASISKSEEMQIEMQDILNILKSTRPSAPSAVLGRYLMFLSRYGKR
ncbi:MAG: AAA family ATPase [Candidatus Micrarchaeaceae archaeon]